jgi:hypothetical protein
MKFLSASAIILLASGVSAFAPGKPLTVSRFADGTPFCWGLSDRPSVVVLDLIVPISLSFYFLTCILEFLFNVFINRSIIFVA